MTLYFSRLRLKHDPANNALKALIDPPDKDRRMDAHHRLLWSAFSDGPGRERDFLWRAEPRGQFFTLSHREPQSHGLFEAPEIKIFEPVLKAGDKLAFLLRANAVTQLPKNPNDRSPSGRVRSRKVDVAMNLLKDVPPRRAKPGRNEKSERAEKRHDIAAGAAKDWLRKKGEACGFALADGRFMLDDYSTISLSRPQGSRRAEPRFGIFDMKGELQVTDPEAFVEQIANGFGRAKSYGCGLMMIRRV